MIKTQNIICNADPPFVYEKLFEITPNNSNSIQLVTLKNSGGTTLGTFTMTANSVELVKKTSTDTLTGAATTLAVKVASTW